MADASSAPFAEAPLGPFTEDLPQFDPSGEVSVDVADGAVTLQPQVGTRLAEVRPEAMPSAPPPGGVRILGLFSFAVEGVDTGGTAMVRLQLPEGVSANTWFRYGPEPDERGPHWYDFSRDLESGVLIEPDGVVIMRFVDGGRGDDDLVANGRIVDAGGPAVTENLPPTAVILYWYSTSRHTGVRRSDRGDPFNIFLSSIGSRDPEGSISAVQWLMPDGSRATGEEASWVAPDGSNDLRRFVVAVTDGQGATTLAQSYIRVPPEMGLECEVTDKPDPGELDVYVKTTDREPYGAWHQGIGEPELIWYEFDWGDGTEQDGFAGERHYYEKGGFYTVAVRSGGIHPRMGERVQIDDCSVEVFIPLRVEDLSGTLTITRTGFHEFGADVFDWRTDEKLTITINVLMRADAEDPAVLVDNGSTYTVDRVVTGLREYVGCVERWTDTASGTYEFVEPTNPDLPEGGAIDGSILPELGTVLVIATASYPSRNEGIGCASTYTSDLPVFDAWSCGEQLGFGLEGRIQHTAEGRVTVDFECTNGPNSSFGDPEIDQWTLTVSGTLTLNRSLLPAP